MQIAIENLGKVAPTVEKGYWDSNKAYDRLVIVRPSSISYKTYISRKPVPAGTPLSNKEYWIPFSSLQESYENWANTLQGLLNQYYSTMQNAISFKGDIEVIPAGETRDVGFTFDCINAEGTVMLDIYKDGVQVAHHNATTFPYHFVISNGGTGLYRCEADVNGIKYVGLWDIKESYDFWIGTGADYNEVLSNASYKHAGASSLSGTYFLNPNENDYIFIICRSNVVPTSVTMSGFDVPLSIAETITVEGIEYSVYQSANTYQQGSIEIKVNDIQYDTDSYIAHLIEEVLSLKTKAEGIEEEVRTIADEETITVTENNKVALKNRPMKKSTTTGEVIQKGYVILKESDNFSDVMDAYREDGNVIFEIDYAFDLGGQSVTIPEGCTLKFEGGQISNSTLINLSSNVQIVNGTLLNINEVVLHNNCNILNTSFDAVHTTWINGNACLISGCKFENCDPSVNNGYAYINTNKNTRNVFYNGLTIENCNFGNVVNGSTTDGKRCLVIHEIINFVIRNNNFSGIESTPNVETDVLYIKTDVASLGESVFPYTYDSPHQYTYGVIENNVFENIISAKSIIKIQSSGVVCQNNLLKIGSADIQTACIRCYDSKDLSIKGNDITCDGLVVGFELKGIENAVIEANSYIGHNTTYKFYLNKIIKSKNCVFRNNYLFVDNGAYLLNFDNSVNLLVERNNFTALQGQRLIGNFPNYATHTVEKTSVVIDGNLFHTYANNYTEFIIDKFDDITYRNNVITSNLDNHRLTITNSNGDISLLNNGGCPIDLRTDATIDCDKVEINSTPIYAVDVYNTSEVNITSSTLSSPGQKITLHDVPLTKVYKCYISGVFKVTSASGENVMIFSNCKTESSINVTSTGNPDYDATQIQIDAASQFWKVGSNTNIGTFTINTKGSMLFNSTLNGPVFFDGTKYVDTKNVNMSGVTRLRGTTGQRTAMTLTSVNSGFVYYDADLKKYVLWNGTAWTNLDGTALS